MRVHGIMLVGPLRILKFTLAACIRWWRSALHVSLKVLDERPAGLLLLDFDASGNRSWLDTSNRLWLAAAEEAEPPPVAGNGRRMGASLVLRTPWG